MSTPKFVLAYTDSETVKLDFDRTTLDNVKYWARRAKRFFGLGGFLVQESSEGSYHVVFNRAVLWVDNVSIMASIAIQSGHKGLRRWVLLQCRKKSSTLRVSHKGLKPSPTIVYREGKQDEGIASYLEYSEIIKDILNEISKC